MCANIHYLLSIIFVIKKFQFREGAGGHGPIWHTCGSATGRDGASSRWETTTRSTLAPYPCLCLDSGVVTSASASTWLHKRQPPVLRETTTSRGMCGHAMDDPSAPLSPHRRGHAMDDPSTPLSPHRHWTCWCRWAEEVHKLQHLLRTSSKLSIILVLF